MSRRGSRSGVTAADQRHLQLKSQKCIARPQIVVMLIIVVDYKGLNVNGFGFGDMNDGE